MWIIIVAVIIIGGGSIIANRQAQNVDEAKMTQDKKDDGEIEKDETPEQETAEEKEDEEMEKKTDDKMMKSSTSRYVEYSKAALDQAADNRRVLYFYANWCPICKPADADFRANSNKIPADLTVIRVNYNDSDTDSQEKDLAKKYGITYQHTFVQIDSQGNEVTKWNGGQTDELIANIK